MEVLTATELKLRKPEILGKIRSGAVFIHPTDTIYGLGCNALNQKAVEKIRQLKNRATGPFSIWVPNKEWIVKHCVVDKKVQVWLDKLPGPYTLIVRLKDKKALASNISAGVDTIGLRLPDHWFSKIVKELDFPIVTTSANKSGEPFMTSLEDLDPNIEKGVEFMMYEGPKEAKPSKIINPVTEEVVERFLK